MNRERFRNIARYGYRKEMYQDCIPHIAQADYNNAKIVSRITLGAMILFGTASLAGLISRSFFIVYLIPGIVFAVLIIAMYRQKKSGLPLQPENARMDIYTCCSGMLLFGVLASAADTSTVATSFLVVQVLTATLITDNLIRFTVMEAVYTVIFAVVSVMLKPAAVAGGDVLNGIIFFVVAVFLHYWLQKERISHFMVVNKYDRTYTNLVRMSRVDELACVLNRQAFMTSARKILAAEKNPDMLFMIIDIDRFKMVNDTYGHQTGDQTVRAVGCTLMHVLLEESSTPAVKDIFRPDIDAHEPDRNIDAFYDRRDDRWDSLHALAGRLGGDEFVCLIGGRDPMNRIERIFASLQGLPLPDDDTVSCSIGVCRAGHEKNTDRLYSHADAALYHAKGGGRGQICIYEDLPEAAEKSREKETSAV